MAGVAPSVMLGAAGILTVALGFASQTSVSNIISGLFLLTERPFVDGDAISFEATVGEAVSVDLLSVKVRTFDNRFVRVPSEMVLKAQLTNLTRYPVRRLDLEQTIPHEAPLDRVRSVLLGVATEHPRALEHPAPIIIVERFVDHGVVVRFSAWVATANWLAAKQRISERVELSLEQAGIELARPSRVLRFESGDGPLRVALELAPTAAHSVTGSDHDEPA